ncbi:MAG: hypothetical protein IIU83_08715 [Fibrobacteraceae bacterium]|nr:hypothetical protein [Fibrobacteraceae bacterium]
MATNQERFDELIGGFQRQCETWKSKNPTMDFVFNNDLRGISIDSLEYIFVGDNPGKTEKNRGVYLVNEPAKPNNSGTIAKRIFDVICPFGNYIVLNKTPIYIDKTSELKVVNKRVLDSSLRYMAQLLFNLHCLKPEIKIFIFGFGDGCFHPKSYDKKGTLSAFFERLKALYEETSLDASRLRIMKHFSYHNFFESFTYYTDETNGVSLCKNLTLEDMEEADFPVEQLLQCIDELPYRNYLFAERS